MKTSTDCVVVVRLNKKCQFFKMIFLVDGVTWDFCAAAQKWLKNTALHVCATCAIAPSAGEIVSRETKIVMEKWRGSDVSVACRTK